MRKTIKGQILFGYLILLIIPVLMTVITLAYLWKINTEVSIVGYNRQNQNMTKDAIVGHYSWLLELENTLNNGEAFTGSIDPSACGLGSWLAQLPKDDLEDTAIAGAIATLQKPHEEIHKGVTSLIELSKTDQEAANRIYLSEIKPKISVIISNIDTITEVYQLRADQGEKFLKGAIIALIQTSLLLLVLGVALSVLLGRKISKRISKPIQSVAKWSKELALGYDDIKFDTLDLRGLDPKNEVVIMTEAFKMMAKGLQNNINVVKRVADGDLTAFVEVRSSHDTLGRYLYHMVQSNDFMFANILNVASNVALSANEISNISHSLTASATQQSSSVEKLSADISKVNFLAIENTQKVGKVLTTFSGIQSDVKYSEEQMMILVKAVEEIRKASDQVSVVIKSIEDISFQTNILALNAAIEAARAGVAGKGFAVVADEVRRLALKSSIAADETKELIQSTINKTHYGVKIAKETSETFEKISSNIIDSVDVVEEIAGASKSQEEAIHSVHISILEVSSIAGMTSESCEESSAASDEMHRSAKVLQKEMSKFNLRQREYGKPYIPPEKRDDPTFIKEANENYQKALEQGRTNEEKLKVASK